MTQGHNILPGGEVKGVHFFYDIRLSYQIVICGMTDDDRRGV